MTTHDPKQVIEDFRNQLARHDRTLVFLFGAGTSSAINIAPEPDDGNKREYIPLIPGIDGLTEACRTAVESMGESHPAAWQMLIEQCDQAGQPANVENLLSRVRMKIEAMGEEEKLVGLDRNQLRSVERTISATIAKTVNPSDDSIPRHTPHGDFAAWVKKVNRTSPLEICTTNYDILLERALEFARVPIFDGFVGTNDPFFYPECLDDEKQLPESNWVRLWKLHGSVNWHVQELPDGKRFIRGVPSESGELILPSLWKYTESRKQPYVAYMDRLSRLMNSEHALLITSGYSFGDEHINEILFAALDNGETRNVVALLYHDLDESD
ncbi:MAG: SIR2 family protein, partial [Candidatus Marinimicrobia bacterium]|nr:SIR2 family protein [Candidatus Neomarinimicrobiota bacterium]